MKGDFTRQTFNAHKHFSRVLLQQGRVQLDADPNEQTAILLHYLQTLAADLIGPHAGTDNGFKIEAVDANGNPLRNDFAIHEGRYYVDGILCENELPTTFRTQPDIPFSEDDWKEGQSLVYLDVWERYIGCFTDDTIREKALGGPDTAGRAKTVWQVKLLPPKEREAPVTCGDVSRLLPLSPPRLRARIRPEQSSTDPCIVTPDSNYRGAENRLYRVEIHTANNPETGAKATFKWSRDNGAIATAWLRSKGNAVIVANARGFAEKQWVELTHDADELQGKPGKLAQIMTVDGDELTLNAAVSWNGALKNPLVRRWDYAATTTVPLSPCDNAVPISEDSDSQNWIDLEDGVQIQFQPPLDAMPPNQYRTGDYWLIPARTATGNIEWPSDLDSDGRPIPTALPPHGIEHHYAPLAVITVVGGEVTVKEPDCRCQIKPTGNCPRA